MTSPISWTIDNIVRPMRSQFNPEAAASTTTGPQPATNKRQQEDSAWPNLGWHTLFADILNALSNFPEAYDAVRRALARNREEPVDVRS